MPSHPVGHRNGEVDPIDRGRHDPHRLSEDRTGRGADVLGDPTLSVDQPHLNQVLAEGAARFPYGAVRGARRLGHHLAVGEELHPIGGGAVGADRFGGEIDHAVEDLPLARLDQRDTTG